MHMFFNKFTTLSTVYFSNMASSEDDDDHIRLVDEDDSHHWVPIQQTEQDGQGMDFPELTPTPSLPMSPIPSTSAYAPEHKTWNSIIDEHNALLSNKATMDRRKFNKSVLILLNKTIALVKETLLSNTIMAPNVIPWHNQNAAFSKYRDILLNDKEIKSEELVEQIVFFVNQNMSPLLTADERKEELQKKSLALLQDLSPQMSIKLAPIVKSYIARQFGVNIEDMLAEVSLPELSLQDKTAMYTRMIDNFLDDVGCISFAFSNRRLLGNIAPVDLWFLTFFAFVTVRRCRGDNLLMLGCVGKSQRFFLNFSITF